MLTRNLSILLVTAMALVLTTGQVIALPTQVVHQNTPLCDTLLIPTNVHEIGDPSAGFPMDEQLSSLLIGSANPVCGPGDPLIPDFLIDIRNLTGKAWEEVWYVADAETNITNFDGEANDIAFGPVQEAFRIDRLISDPGGSHHPLLSESLTPDGIWEVGESWQFVLQDYTNTAGLLPDAINSLGIGDASSPSPAGIDSSGSIIAVEKMIPEPACAVLALMGLSTIGFVRLRQKD